MDASTRAQLHAINRRFYDEHAAAFDRKRGRPWPGWKDLLGRLDGLPAAPRVLDAGCGNGRFGAFLAEQAAHQHLETSSSSSSMPTRPTVTRPTIHYHGIDSSATLLARAKERLHALNGIEAQLERRDLLRDGLPESDYDLVVCFGVLHHVAGREQREGLARELATRLTPGGYLAFTCWRFLASPRVRGLRRPWPEALRGEEPAGDPDRDPRLEAGDALLDFDGRADALRYCHHVDEAEMIALTEAAAAEPEVEIVARWKADGATGDLNHYALLRRAEQRRIAG